MQFGHRRPYHAGDLDKHALADGRPAVCHALWNQQRVGQMHHFYDPYVGLLSHEERLSINPLRCWGAWFQREKGG